MAERVPELDVALLRADAQDLPLRDGSVSAAVSLNGLHVMPHARAFVAELGRVIEPGGRLWVITLVSGGTLRADAVIRSGRLLGILPGAPPERTTLERWLSETGFTRLEPLGGEGLLGLAATRSERA
jgi:ubiquinone/menaquinone biosynthesis C-methylase UbiE